MIKLGHYQISNQDIAYVFLIAAVVIVLAVVISSLIKRRSVDYFDKRWKDLQKLLAKKTTWNDAVIAADKLLDEALKQRRFKGKTMGERLVAAQHELSANDMVWFGHKLKNKIDSDNLKPTKAEVKRGLLGFWQALRDLGVFPKDEK